MQEECKSCFYWKFRQDWSKTEHSEMRNGKCDGHCRHNPPVIDSELGTWPITMEDDVCSQFRMNASQDE